MKRIVCWIFGHIWSHLTVRGRDGVTVMVSSCDWCGKREWKDFTCWP